MHLYCPWPLLPLLLLLSALGAASADSLELEERLLEPPRLGARLEYDPVSGSTLAHYVSRQRRSYRLRPPEMFSAAEQRSYRHRLRAIRQRGWPAGRRRRGARLSQFRGTVSGLLRAYRGMVRLLLRLVTPAKLDGDADGEESTNATETATGGDGGGGEIRNHTGAGTGTARNVTRDVVAGDETPFPFNITWRNSTAPAAANTAGSSAAGRPGSPSSQTGPPWDKLTPDLDHPPHASLLAPDPPPSATDAAADAAAVRTLGRFFGALMDGGEELRDRLIGGAVNESHAVKRAAREAFETLWARLAAPGGAEATIAGADGSESVEGEERRAAAVLWDLIEQFLDAHDASAPRRAKRGLDLTGVRHWLSSGGEEEETGWDVVRRFTTDHREGGAGGEAIVGNVGVNWTAVGEWIAENMQGFDDFSEGNEEEQTWSWTRLLQSLVENHPEGSPAVKFEGPFDWLSVYETIVQLFNPEPNDAEISSDPGDMPPR